MPTELTDRAPERGSFGVEFTFLDQDGSALTPKAGLNWTLTDVEGTVVNGRENVAITAASTVTVVLSGLDLAVGDGLFGFWRKLLIQGTYDSTLGTNLPLTDEVWFEIQNFTKPDGIT